MKQENQNNLNDHLGKYKDVFEELECLLFTHKIKIGPAISSKVQVARIPFAFRRKCFKMDF